MSDTIGPVHGSGEISAMDLVSWYWRAPNSYLGDKRGYYGRELRFCLKTRASFIGLGTSQAGDIILRSKSLTLLYDFEEKPNKNWKEYRVSLDATEKKWLHTDKKNLANETQLREVLMDIEDLLIRGEYKENKGDEETWLKGVSFGAEKNAVYDPCEKAE